MGELTEARRLYEEVVPGQMAQLGPAHPDTLLAKGNLANLLKMIGQQAEARLMHEEVLGTGEQAEALAQSPAAKRRKE